MTKMQKSVLAVITLLGGAACGADSIAAPEETQQVRTLVSLAARVDAGSYTGLSNLVSVGALEMPSFDPRTCVHLGSDAGFTCTAQLVEHFTYQLRFSLFDAQGQPVRELTSASVSSAHVWFDVTGTYTPPPSYMEPTVTLNRHTIATIEGLSTGTVTLNGTTSYSDFMGAAPFANHTTVSGTATNLRLPMIEAAYPASGTIVTSYTNYSGVSNDVMTVNSTVTFNGTSHVPVSVDFQTRHLDCIADLTLPFGSPCPG
jgi:hypothetical protein